MEQEQQLQKMTEMPVGPLILRLAVPTIVSMLITSVYNMADTFFVARLGTSASGAVGIVFPIMAMIQAIGFTLGMGSGSFVSRLLGAGEEEKSREVAASGFYSALILGGVLAVAGLWKLEKLLEFLGASGTIRPFARSYARYILYAAPVMSASFVLTTLLRSEGRANFAMLGIALGGLLNIGLDPLLMFRLKMGITGAALSTAVSQLVSFCFLIVVFFRGRTTTSLRIRYVSRDWHSYAEILKNGLPSFVRQGLSSSATVLLNLRAVSYGDAAVAAMSIVGKIFMIVFSMMIGFGQGYQPVAGYSHGAGDEARVQEAVKFTLKAGTALMIIIGAAVFLSAPILIGLFISDDPAVQDIAVTALRAQCIGMPFLPVGIVANMTYQAIGKAGTATFLSGMRQGIFFLPLILILPELFGIFGIEITQAAADICTALCCIPYMIYFTKAPVR